MTMAANPIPARSQSLRAAPLANPFVKSTINTATTSPQSQQGPSHVSLLLTNLRLLNLDLLPDWPGITPTTFSTTTTHQDAKKRIRAVEWILYHLFTLYVPETARTTLDPHWPALEPLQSKTLRQALYRCLDTLKKDGVLGRDAVLRKTMLDECKGERLEEVLSLFSTVVLKKLLCDAGASGGAIGGGAATGGAIAPQLAMQSLGYKGEKTVLTALIIAYQKTLRGQLKQKNEERRRYAAFAAQMDDKQDEIQQELRQLSKDSEAADVLPIPASETERLRAAVRENWVGNTEVLQVLLDGESSISRDGILDKPYYDVWQHVRNGTNHEADEEPNQTLLVQLEARVEQQQRRLLRWQEFEMRLQRREPPGSPQGKTMPSIDPSSRPRFDAHMNLLPGLIPLTTAEPNPHSVYTQMKDNMRGELASVGASRMSADRLSVHRARRRDNRRQPTAGGEESTKVRQTSMSGNMDDLVTRLDATSLQSEEMDDTNTRQAHDPHNEVKCMPQSSLRAPTVYHKSMIRAPRTVGAAIPKHPAKASSFSAAPVLESQPSVAAPPIAIPPQKEPTQHQFHTTPLRPSPPVSLSLLERTSLALQAVQASTTNNSQHPTKPAMPHKLIALPQQPSILDSQPTIIPTPTSTLAAAESPSTPDPLSARPRTSILSVDLEAMTQKAELNRRQSLKRAERAKRESFRPNRPRLNDSLNEGVSDGGSEGGRESDGGFAVVGAGPSVRPGLGVLGEVDALAETDYESVFMSRPKIGLSPVLSPIRDGVWEPDWNGDGERL